MDLRGNLILSHNDTLVKARIKSAAPRAACHGRYIADIPSLGLRGKIKATLAAIGFIWGPNLALTPEAIRRDGL